MGLKSLVSFICWRGGGLFTSANNTGYVHQILLSRVLQRRAEAEDVRKARLSPGKAPRGPARLQ